MDRITRNRIRGWGRKGKKRVTQRAYRGTGSMIYLLILPKSRGDWGSSTNSSKFVDASGLVAPGRVMTNATGQSSKMKRSARTEHFEWEGSVLGVQSSGIKVSVLFHTCIMVITPHRVRSDQGNRTRKNCVLGTESDRHHVGQSSRLRLWLQSTSCPVFPEHRKCAKWIIPVICIARTAEANNL